MKNQVEFKPPSDFVADDSGGGNNVWKYVGIGCGVVLLIVGLAFAFGAWKTASCCGDVVDATKHSMAAGQAASTFANNVSQGKIDDAYAQTSDAFKERTSKEQFREQLGQHAEMLRSSAPRQSGLNAQTSGQDEGEIKPTGWTMSYEFAGANSERKLVMTLEVIRKGEGEDATFSIDDIRFDERRRVLSAEPPAEAVTDFHRNIRRGSYDQAYKLMAPEYSTNNDRAAFETFISDYEAAFLGSEPRIVAVDYAGGATVVAETMDEQGGAWRIEYSLTRSIGPTGWAISAISPRDVDAGKAGQPAEKSDDGRAGGADGEADNAEAAEGSDEDAKANDEAENTAGDGAEKTN